YAYKLFAPSAARGSDRALNPAFVPEAQVEYAPEMKAPVARVTTVLLQHARDEPVIEEVSPFKRRVREIFVEPFAQVIAKPTVDGRAEAALGAVEQVVRQNIFQRAL